MAVQVSHGGHTSSHPPHQQWRRFPLSPPCCKHLSFLNDSHSDWGEVNKIFFIWIFLRAKMLNIQKDIYWPFVLYLRTVCSVHWPTYLLARVFFFAFFFLLVLYFWCFSSFCSMASKSCPAGFLFILLFLLLWRSILISIILFVNLEKQIPVLFGIPSRNLLPTSYVQKHFPYQSQHFWF